MPRTITPATSLENLRKEAKRWLKALRADDPDPRARLERAYPNAPERPVLRDVQHALAREYGHESWTALKDALAKPHVERAAPSWPAHTLEEYERLAHDIVAAFDSHDEAALQRLNEHYRRSFTFDDLWAEIWRRVYAFRQRSSRVPKNDLQLDEAQVLVAQDAGSGSWSALAHAVASGTPPVPAYGLDETENKIGPRRQLSDPEWDELIAVMNERRITALAAEGVITDAVLARVAELDHVTALSLGPHAVARRSGPVRMQRSDGLGPGVPGRTATLTPGAVERPAQRDARRHARIPGARARELLDVIA